MMTVVVTSCCWLVVSAVEKGASGRMLASSGVRVWKSMAEGSEGKNRRNTGKK